MRYITTKIREDLARFKNLKTKIDRITKNINTMALGSFDLESQFVSNRLIDMLNYKNDLIIEYNELKNKLKRLGRDRLSIAYLYYVREKPVHYFMEKFNISNRAFYRRLTRINKIYMEIDIYGKSKIYSETDSTTL
ncbi:MAG: hypothetical protein II238_01230 [Alphaproteobacteria bacterium]|nr:hypothetical protein [Alphaproteobacteria bacterium]